MNKIKETRYTIFPYQLNYIQYTNPNIWEKIVWKYDNKLIVLNGDSYDDLDSDDKLWNEYQSKSSKTPF